MKEHEGTRRLRLGDLNTNLDDLERIETKGIRVGKRIVSILQDAITRIEVQSDQGCASSTLVALGADITAAVEFRDYRYGSDWGKKEKDNYVDRYGTPPLELNTSTSRSKVFLDKLFDTANSFGVGICTPTTSTEFIRAMEDESTIGAAIVTNSDVGHVVAVVPSPGVEVEDGEDTTFLVREEYLVVDTARGRSGVEHTDIVEDSLNISTHSISPNGLSSLYAGADISSEEDGGDVGEAFFGKRMILMLTNFDKDEEKFTF